MSADPFTLMSNTDPRCGVDSNVRMYVSDIQDLRSTEDPAIINDVTQPEITAVKIVTKSMR
jgi:hypothetical protein